MLSRIDELYTEKNDVLTCEKMAMVDGQDGLAEKFIIEKLNK